MSYLRVGATTALLVLALTGCAPGPNPDVGIAADNGVVAGFWLGLWHGFILPVTFLISLFTDQVTIYEVHNSGNWYDFGYVLGLGTSVGGGPFGARSARRGR